MREYSATNGHAGAWLALCRLARRRRGRESSNSILMDGERNATAVFEADETDDASSGQEAPQSALCSGISGALIGLTLIGLMRSGRTARRRST